MRPVAPARSTWPRYADLRYVNLDAPEEREATRRLRAGAWADEVGEAFLDEAQKEPSSSSRRWS